MDNNEEGAGKGASRRAPCHLPTVESNIDDDEEEETEEEEDEDHDDEYGQYELGMEEYEYFSSQGIDGDLSLLEEGEDSSSESGFLEEDDIDPDDLSYEQLIELGEIIGEEKRGLSADQISSCLLPSTYQPANSPGLGTDRCVICQVEFGEGEKLAALSCKHPYHSECIGRWLEVKKTCPICSIQVSAPNAADS
ncbi:hypothetical protein SAY86_003698 [Trapa natans]|uniref:RING-type domain-containing protein n=1 Tax=Trapa natans TaxID=22666 RepID=A0AAN7RN19_TRANT|nr:hypothetical protein SAY86_003698 [Trapa natans]